jgi:hypothetical protein
LGGRRVKRDGFVVVVVVDRNTRISGWCLNQEMTDFPTPVHVLHMY